MTLMDRYLAWVCSLAFPDESVRQSYSNLLLLLDTIPFRYTLPLDENRYIDGISLRYRFGYCNQIDDAIIKEELESKPCSVLEVLIALALKCEEEIMSDYNLGDRTSVWFWTMICNLKISQYTNQAWDSISKRNILQRLNVFLDRKYSSNGQGGLFIVNNPKDDMRTTEIWYQMCWYVAAISA